MNRLKTLSIGALVFLFSAAYSPATVTIDLRDPGFGAGFLQPLISEQGLTISTNLGTLWWDAVDGIGIQGTTLPEGYEKDEVESLEILKVESMLTMVGIWVSDLFTETRQETQYSEIGEYSTDGVNWVSFVAPAANLSSPITNGELFLNIPSTKTLFLRALGLVGIEDHDFALQRVLVPEPSTLALLGLGGLGLGLLRRRVHKQRI